jgi:hypothetical protein
VPHHDATDEFNQPWFRKELKAIASVLDQWFNDKAGTRKRKIGFALLVFPFGKTDSRCAYVSKGAKRRDAIAMLKKADREASRTTGRKRQSV